MDIRQALELKVKSLQSWISDRVKPLKVKQDKRCIMNGSISASNILFNIPGYGGILEIRTHEKQKVSRRVKHQTNWSTLQK